MLDAQSAPVAWALLQYELADAQEGIASLLRDMAEDKEFSKIEFSIHMAHIYGHLNRAWNGRNATDKQWQADKLPDEWSNLPTDADLPAPF
jgi:hypothetical protein